MDWLVQTLWRDQGSIEEEVDAMFCIMDNALAGQSNQQQPLNIFVSISHPIINTPHSPCVCHHSMSVHLTGRICNSKQAIQPNYVTFDTDPMFGSLIAVWWEISSTWKPSVWTWVLCCFCKTSDASAGKRVHNPWLDVTLCYKTACDRLGGCLPTQYTRGMGKAQKTVSAKNFRHVGCISEPATPKTHTHTNAAEGRFLSLAVTAKPDFWCCTVHGLDSQI